MTFCSPVRIIRCHSSIQRLGSELLTVFQNTFHIGQKLPFKFNIFTARADLEKSFCGIRKGKHSASPCNGLMSHMQSAFR